MMMIYIILYIVLCYVCCLGFCCSLFIDLEERHEISEVNDAISFALKELQWCLLN